MEDNIGQAIRAVKDGGVIIFPTDTAFGIGCRVDSKEAVDRLFSLRKRPLTQATPVLVDGESMALTYFDQPSQVVRRFMKEYWPGALTIISRCKNDLVYAPVRGGGQTIGLRMPNHESALSIIRGVGIAMLGPSANFHGDPTPYRFEDLNADFTKLVDVVVPGVCSVGMASTVVDCSVEPYVVRRQGSVVV